MLNFSKSILIKKQTDLDLERPFLVNYFFKYRCTCVILDLFYYRNTFYNVMDVDHKNMSPGAKPVENHQIQSMGDLESGV